MRKCQNNNDCGTNCGAHIILSLTSELKWSTCFSQMNSVRQYRVDAARRETFSRRPTVRPTSPRRPVISPDMPSSSRTTERVELKALPTDATSWNNTCGDESHRVPHRWPDDPEARRKASTQKWRERQTRSIVFRW